ncbi:MAG: Sir2 family NAD-dependent protein deacetylase [Myxococcota bacterium]|nr:Sir2 family NAD-dependent protein deacetylase [Myxococcota bacterium]
MELPAEQTALLRTAFSGDGLIIALTGAGISAESGIPTFRGPEGYWTIGSRQYRPTQMATYEMFRAAPQEVWSWYLYRRSVCRSAEPNAGHHQLARLDQALHRRFLLVTQNVDGLHLRAGNAHHRSFQIHGNIDYMRCARPCSDDLRPVPDIFDDWPKDRRANKTVLDRLRCPQCGDLLRPHVLWFDEYYDESLFRYESALNAIGDADLLITIGTSGATNLPVQMVRAALGAGVCLVDINPEVNRFGVLAESAARGFYLPTSASDGLRIITQARTSVP